MGITLSMVIYNEAGKILEPLESVKGLVDEYIIVHDGPCGDNTIEILEKYRKENRIDMQIIVTDEHLGIPCPHRVQSYEKAKNEWILSLDADCSLSPELRRVLPELIKDKTVGAYSFPVSFHDGQKHHFVDCHRITSLYRKKDMFFIGIPHYPVSTRGPVKAMPYFILHNHKPMGEISMRSFVNSYKNKYIPWARIHAEYLLKPYEELPKLNARREDWDTPKRRRIMRFPLLMAVVYFFYNIGKALFKEKYYRLGKYGYHNALSYGLYSFLVYSLVWRYKRERAFCKNSK